MALRPTRCSHCLLPALLGLTLLSTYYAPAALASVLFLQCTPAFLPWEPLHSPFPLPGTLFPTSPWLPPIPPTCSVGSALASHRKVFADCFFYSSASQSWCLAHFPGPHAMALHPLPQSATNFLKIRLFSWITTCIWENIRHKHRAWEIFANWTF